MTWAKFDDGYATHPKVVAAGLEATGLDARSICYCAAHETDGYIGEPEVAMLVGEPKRARLLAQRLVEVGRWVTAEGGYWIHDFLVYNPSREQLESRRKRDRFRKDSGRNPDGNHEESGGNRSGSQADSPRAGAQARIPSRPVTNNSVPHHSGVPLSSEAEEALESPEVHMACGLVAKTRMARLRERPSFPNRWQESVAAQVALEYADDWHTWLAQGHDGQAMADRIEPPPPKVYAEFKPLADERLPTTALLNGVHQARSALPGAQV